MEKRSSRKKLLTISLVCLISANQALAGKVILVEHFGIDTDDNIVSVYKDIYNMDHIDSIDLETDRRCEEGTITFRKVDGEEHDWEYKRDVCDLFDDLLDFLEDEDELLFKMEWSPLD